MTTERSYVHYVLSEPALFYLTGNRLGYRLLLATENKKDIVHNYFDRLKIIPGTSRNYLHFYDKAEKLLQFSSALMAGTINIRFHN